MRLGAKPLSPSRRAKSPKGWGRGQHEGRQGAHPLVVGWETKKGGGRQKEADACCPQHPAWPEQTFKCLVKCIRVHLTTASSREHLRGIFGDMKMEEG